MSFSKFKQEANEISYIFVSVSVKSNLYVYLLGVHVHVHVLFCEDFKQHHQLLDDCLWFSTCRHMYLNCLVDWISVTSIILLKQRNITAHDVSASGILP